MDIYSESPEIIKGFLVYMSTVKGKSENTVREYYLDLRTFFRFIKRSRGLVKPDTEFTDIDISDVDLDLIKTVTLDDGYNFMLFLQRERNNNASTRCRKASSLSTFFKYLTNKKMLLAIDPLEGLENPKVGKRLPKYLTLEQCYDLLNAVEGQFKERDYCILVLFLNCGMRLSELCSINYNSISSDGTLRIVGKGNKERSVYLNKACLDAVNEYKKVRPVDGVRDKNALFISRQLNRMSPKTVQALVNKYLEKIGLGGQGYSVHKLRHTAATLMYQHGGVDIRILKEILGHENLGTTEIYTHLSTEQMKQAVMSNPLSSVAQKKKNDHD